MMSEFESHDRRRAFFGRRKGHPLKRTQAALIDTLLPRLAIDLASPAPKNLATLFAHQPAQVQLEIGFGGGEHLIAQAQAHPEIGFIGCEPFVNGMGKALVAIEARELTNIRLHFGDAIDLLDWLPDGSLAGVDLLYPDPWPKKRHWKRRFVQDATVAAHCARAAVRRGIPVRQRHSALRRVDAGAPAAFAGLFLDRRTRRRLAAAMGGLGRNPLRSKGQARRANAGVFHFSAPGLTEFSPIRRSFEACAEA